MRNASRAASRRPVPSAAHPGLVVDAAADEDVLQLALVARSAASRAPEVTAHSLG